MSLHPLDQGTALSRHAEDRFVVQLNPLFWGTTAAHGGYLGAVLLRAMTERINDAMRHPRSLTVHFLKGPEVGEAEVQTEILRSGGKLTQITAKLVQNGAPTTFAVAAFAAAFEGEERQQAVMPEVPVPESCARLNPSKVQVDHRFEHRQCLGGAPFSGAREARIGGFSRFAEPRPIDALTMTVLCDAWWPALFPTFATPKQAGACPTVDLTIHFRTSFPLLGASPSDYVLVDLHTERVHEGFLDERCSIWSKDGQLLAQSVQHAVRLLPRK